MGKPNRGFWKPLQATRRSERPSHTMLNCFVILVMADWKEKICEYCLMWHYLKIEGNRRWHFLLTGWTVTLRWKSSECGCSVSDVSYFDVILVVKMGGHGADTCISIVWVTLRAQCCKQFIPASSIWSLVSHIFHLIVSSIVHIDTKGISFMDSLGFTPVHLQPPARWTKWWTSGDILISDPASRMLGMLTTLRYSPGEEQHYCSPESVHPKLVWPFQCKWVSVPKPPERLMRSGEVAAGHCF